MRPIRVLVLHNAYQLKGGEDSVVRYESEMLAENGNLAGVCLVTNTHINGILGKLRAALGVVFSLSSYRFSREKIRELHPCVVHVHNFFPLLSPSVFYACLAERVPVVFTLHNYRIICPTALLMHDGKVSERSLDEGPWWALRYRVYRGSWVGTFLLCLMISVHKRIGTWRNNVDRFIVLSNFAVSKFAKGGIPSDKMVVKPNFVDLPVPATTCQRSGLLFIGRLSPEKGMDVLLDAASLGQFSVADIRIAGDGPLAGMVTGRDVTFLGALPANEVRQNMQAATALLLPSVWYEGFPMVLVEAYANGLPVIASRLGALAELVEDGVTGLLFEPGNANDLAGKMRWALDNPNEMSRMGEAARKRYEDLYTPEQNYEQLMEIYRHAIGSHHNKAKLQ